MRWLALAVTLWAGAAEAACRQALALGLDVSGSVDAREYRQQLDGLADALTRPAVVSALLAMPAASVDLAVYEWSGPTTARLLLPWRRLGSETAIRDAAGQLARTARIDGDPSTAIGSAMRRGAALLAGRGGCWRRVLDLSGDGKSNTGPRPRDVATDGTLAGITVNALVIGGTDAASGDIRHEGIAELTAYFRAEVIRGPDAFVETALGFDDYADAMERKLIRELQVATVGAAPAGATAAQ